jgi:predicted aconitase with swiveling domain
MTNRIKGRVLVKGMARGLALVTNEPLSFLGGVDPKTGIVVEHGHELEGLIVTNRILVFPYGKGSTVGSYTLLAMSKEGTKPAGIVNRRSEAIIAAGCVLADIPLMDNLEKDPIEIIQTGDLVTLDAKNGFVIIRRDHATER